MLSAKSFASPLPIPDVAPIIIAFFILNFVCLLCRPTMRHNVPVACAVADIKILPLAYEPKAEERKVERKATPPPLRNCHVLAAVRLFNILYNHLLSF